MAKLRYRRGQERDIVLEKSNYKESVFWDQYTRSLSLLNDYLSDIDDRSLKTIAYYGGRGDGKTSCMMSVLDIIEKSRDVESEAYRMLQNIGCDKMTEKKCEVMGVIDPSFFDENHNVLEIIIGHLYNSFRKYSDKITNPDLTQKNNLQAAFQEVKRSLYVLSKGEYESLNDLKELGILSTSITLHSQMENLITKYLAFIGKDVLIIPIDDIDLNMDHAYMMCEQIRKYLSIPKTVVMISLKIDQLEKIVGYVYRTSIKNNKYISYNETHEMAERYLNKLLPISSRVNMPLPYELVDIEIEIHDGKEMIIEDVPLKMALAQLIFYRTRYLFYNPGSGSSPIVPNNMRDIFNMVGLLASMRSAVDGMENYKEILNENKRLFKRYFYSVWIGQFEKDLKTKLEKLVNFDFGTSFNREVITILTKEFKLEKDYQGMEDDDNDTLIEAGLPKEQKPVNKIISSIISPDNFGYNISVGDVFYILSFLESETLEESQYALVFFLKSLYSIKLYEAYDEITEKEDMIYPIEKDDIKGLTTVDRRFDHINVLQQLVGGSYFTYSPGELIPRGGTEGYDMRIIGSKELYGLIKKVKENIDRIILLASKKDLSKEEIAEIDKFNIELNIVEFFIMTITAQVPQKNTMTSPLSTTPPVIGFLDSARKNVEPFHFRKFSSNTGYFLFDIMAPFANILNPQFAYTRFPQIDNDLYDKIFDYSHSLLYQMMEVSGTYRKHIVKELTKEETNEAKEADIEEEKKKYEQWQKLHRLLSDAAIRNGEVLMAVKNNISIRIRKSHEGSYETLRSFYQDIQNSEMKTLKRSPDGEVYDIMFRFLQPLQNILKNSFSEEKEQKAKGLSKEWSDKFLAVFNCKEAVYSRKNEVATDSIEPVGKWYDDDMETIGRIIGKASKVGVIRRKLLEFMNRSDGDPMGRLLIPGASKSKMSKEEVYRSIRKVINNEIVPLESYLTLLRPSSSSGEVEKPAPKSKELQQPEGNESMDVTLKNSSKKNDEQSEEKNSLKEDDLSSGKDEVDKENKNPELK